MSLRIFVFSLLVSIVVGMGALEPRPATAAAPAPYSLPWHLRPAAPARVLRLDTVVASYEDAQNRSGSTMATLLLASTKVGNRAALLGRVGMVRNSPPVGDDGTVLTNLTVGGLYAPKTGGDLRLAFYLLTALPVGGGGGNDPESGRSAAIRAGVPARSGMDNAMFAMNDIVLFPGLDLAWLKDRWTIQGEMTLLQLWRVRGEKKQVDARRTNLTTGLHVGRFVSSHISIGAEFRYQRWLSTPAAVHSSPKSRDTATAALGARGHFKVGEKTWFRPGIAVGVPLDDPLKAGDYTNIQVDLPLAF